MHKGLFHADSVAVRTKSEAGYFWPRMESNFDVYVQPLALDLTSNDAILNELFIIKDCSFRCFRDPSSHHSRGGNSPGPAEQLVIYLMALGTSANSHRLPKILSNWFLSLFEPRRL